MIDNIQLLMLKLLFHLKLKYIIPSYKKITKINTNAEAHMLWPLLTQLWLLDYSIDLRYESNFIFHDYLWYSILDALVPKNLLLKSNFQNNPLFQQQHSFIHFNISIITQWRKFCLSICKVHFFLLVARGRKNNWLLQTYVLRALKMYGGIHWEV